MDNYDRISETGSAAHNAGDGRGRNPYLHSPDKQAARAWDDGWAAAAATGLPITGSHAILPPDTHGRHRA